MRKSKFSETQTVGSLKDADSGVPVAELLRKLAANRRRDAVARALTAGWSRPGSSRALTLLSPLPGGCHQTGPPIIVRSCDATTFGAPHDHPFDG